MNDINQSGSPMGRDKEAYIGIYMVTRPTHSWVCFLRSD